MTAALAAEWSRTRAIFDAVGHPFPERPGATEADLRHVVETTAIALSGDLAELYRAMDGSNDENVLAVHSDEATPLNFLSLSEALKSWRATMDIAEADRELGREHVPDERIRHAAWVHPRWFPFAEFNGGATSVYYDADPGPGGAVGQIIVYQHDPDGVYYVASDFLAFLRLSNELLAANARDFLL
jgi:cell wall assembly regulator SMI1